MQKRTKPGSAGQREKEGDFSLWEDIGNQLRIDACRAVRVTKSGHPTSSASIADIIAVLFFHPEGLKFHPHNHRHFLNDRIVLSKGHAAPILYAAFYRAGIISEKDLLSLRLKDSLIEGHPVPKIPFVDVATGSLGQGLSVAAGMAYSSKYFDHIDNHIYCITGDGEVAEGSIWEAAAFASKYNLNNLTVFVDVNALGQSQETMYAHHTEVYEARFRAFGFNTIVVDGHSITDIVAGLANSHSQTEKPTALVCRTLKGKGFVEKVEGHLNWHGKDLGGEFDPSLQLLKSKIRRENIDFTTFAPVGDDHLAQPPHVKITPNYKETDIVSTRKAYGTGLLKARESDSRVVGLDADTKNSTFSITLLEKHPESFIECFIAEQNMVGVATGLACRQKIPFCSTFATFFIRAADQIRIAGISGSKLKMVGSHSGCSIGEDGPSQMALEDLAFFRTIPNGIVLIPSDAVSTEKAVELAANYENGPSFIRTARPDVKILFPNNEQFELGKSNSQFIQAKSSSRTPRTS